MRGKILLLKNEFAMRNKNQEEILKTPAVNRRFNFVELAGSVGASGVTHYEIRPPQTGKNILLIGKYRN